MTRIETGMIVDIKRDSAMIALKGDSACVGCRNCDEKSTKNMVINVPIEGTKYAGKTANLKTGDTVRVECESPGQAKIGFLYFILPILLAIAGFAVGTPLLEQAGVKSYQALGGGLAGALFVIPYIVLVLIRKARERRGSRWIRIVDVLHSGGPVKPGSAPACCS